MAQPSGFAAKFTNPTQLDDRWGIDMLLTGAGGSGKTFLIGTAVDDPEVCGKLLIVDINGGMRTVADRPDITVYQPRTWNDLTGDLYDFLKQSKHDFGTVAIDVASEAYKLACDVAIGMGMRARGDQISLEGYGVANTMFLKMIREYRMLATDRGMHVIFTTHTTEAKDEDQGMIKVRANLTPGTLASVIGAVDVVGYLEARESGERRLYLQGTERYQAKARLPRSFPPLPNPVKNPTLGQLIRGLRGEPVQWTTK